MERVNYTPENMSKPHRAYRPFLLLILIISLYLAYLILRPFLHTIILAVVLASLFYPFQVRLVHLYRGKRNAAALTVVAAITFLIIIPVLSFTSVVVTHGLESINQVNEWVSAGNIQKIMERPEITAYTTWLRERLDFIKFTELDLQSHILQLSKNFGQFLLSRGTGLLRDMVSVVSHFFIMMFIAFYMLRDGQKMMEGIKHLSPLREEQEDRIIDKIRVIARSALLGNFVTAVCQGAVGGIGLAIVGIPAVFWGTLMGFASLIPVVGTALVWVPAVGYLALIGKWKASIFLGLWCLVLVGSIDNFLRPFLMRGAGGMSPFYIFLAIIGGVQYFGLVGILYGPLILGFARVMLYIYQLEYQDLLGKKKDLALPESPEQ